MESVLLSLSVTGVFLIVAGAVGYRTGRMGKPYGFVKPAIHIALFMLVLSGVAASIYKLQGLSSSSQYAQISLYIAVLALFANLTVGTAMLIIRNTNRSLVAAHKVSTVTMAISIFASALFVSTGM